MITQKQLEYLISDIEYLKYEADSLNKVINTVPYSDKPLGGDSILENLLTIDLFQSKVLEVLENLKTKGIETDVTNLKDFRKIELSEEEIESAEIETIIKDISFKRDRLVNHISDKPLSYFNLELGTKLTATTLFELFSEMVQQERGILKQIGSLVLTYQKDRQFQRQLAEKRRG